MNNGGNTPLTPRQMWGTCCPSDPECEHSFLDDDELTRYMDTPLAADGNTPCNMMMYPSLSKRERCGKPEDDPIHDPLGPPKGVYDVHVYSPAPVADESDSGRVPSDG